MPIPGTFDGVRISSLIMPAMASHGASSLTLGQQMNAAAGALLPYPSDLNDSFLMRQSQRMTANLLARNLDLYVPPYTAHPLVKGTQGDKSNADAYHEEIALPLFRFGMSVYARNNIESAFADTYYPLHAAHKLGLFSLDVEAAVKTGIVDRYFLGSNILEKMKNHGILALNCHKAVSPHASFFGSPQLMAIFTGGFVAVNNALNGDSAFDGALLGFCGSEILLTIYHLLRRPDQIARANRDLKKVDGMFEALEGRGNIQSIKPIDEVVKSNDGPEMRVFRLRRMMKGADADFPLYPLRANESIYSIPGFDLSTFQFVATKDRESGKSYVRVYTGVDGLPYFDLMKAATLEEKESPIAAGAIWVDHAGYKPRIAYKLYEGEEKGANAAFLDAGIELVH